MTLDHVRWLGGATGAGKSTVATRLVERYGLAAWSADVAIDAHAVNPGPDVPLLASFLASSPDERWLGRPSSTMLRTFPWFAGERFDRIVADLARLPATPPILAEGFRLLPRLVQPLMDHPWQGVWLTTTSERRRDVFTSRPVEEQFWRRTSDPAAALELLLERDAQFADQVVREAESRGLVAVVVDGRRAIDEVADDVARIYAGIGFHRVGTGWVAETNE